MGSPADQQPSGTPDSPPHTLGPWLAGYLPPRPLTSDARGGWRRRRCAPNMAAADQAAHIRSAEGGRAGERARARQARRRLPEALVSVAALSGRTRRAPRPPTPTLTRLTPTLGKGRGKRRGTSLPESGTRRLPQFPAAASAGRRRRQQLQPKNQPLSRERWFARPLPLLGARTSVEPWAAVVVPEEGGKWSESKGLACLSHIPKKGDFFSPQPLSSIMQNFGVCVSSNSRNSLV